MEAEVIKKILENHEKWLEGSGGERANLIGADLKGVNLEGANLEGANFKKANLKGANLKGANLECANLECANLKNACFLGASLEYANLENADFECANLEYVNLENADLKGANIIGADLEGANFMGAKDVPYIPLFCPSDGAFIGWKKINKKIIKLQILEDSKRLSATTRECRCDKAYVMEIQDIKGNKLEITEICSYNSELTYRVGEVVEINDFCEDRWEKYPIGIYFFIDRQEAVSNL